MFIDICLLNLISGSVIRSNIDNISKHVADCFVKKAQNIICEHNDTDKCAEIYIKVEEIDNEQTKVYELEYSIACGLSHIEFNVVDAFEEMFGIKFEQFFFDATLNGKAIACIKLKGLATILKDNKTIALQVLIVETPPEYDEEYTKIIKELRRACLLNLS